MLSASSSRPHSPGTFQDNQFMKSNRTPVDAPPGWRYSRNTGFGTQLQPAAT